MKLKTAVKDVDQIRDNGGKKEHTDLSKPSRTDLKKLVTKRDVSREDKDDYKDTLFDKDLRMGNKMDKITRIAKKITSEFEVKTAAVRKIDGDFEREFQKAIEKQETVSFDYVNKQGKYSLIQLTPTKIETKWGKKVVTGITKYGKEFSFLFDSIGKQQSEEKEPVKKEKVVVLRDDCDFEKEIEKAINDGNKIQFSYLMKNGNRTKITIKPTKLENKWNQRVCTGETYSGERSYLISSMGNNSMGKSEMFQKYAFLKGQIYFEKFNGSYYFFRPISVIDDKIECEKLDSKVYTSSYKDGDVDDGNYAWEERWEVTSTYPGKVIGKELLEVKNNKLYFNGKELRSMDAKHHLERRERVGNTNYFEKDGKYGWKPMNKW